MANVPPDPADLEGGERVLRAWRSEPVRPDGTVDRPGWLVLTDRRLLFYRRSGLLSSGRLEPPPVFSCRLEEVRSAEPQTFWMKIGYGDRVAMPGVSVDGLKVRLNRDDSSQALVAAIGVARTARRTALGLPSP